MTHRIYDVLGGAKRPSEVLYGAMAGLALPGSANANNHLMLLA